MIYYTQNSSHKRFTWTGWTA